MTKNFIVTADDFGCSNTTNRAIIQAITQKRVNSVSIMVNMPASEGALDYCQNVSNLDIGLHFNVLEKNSELQCKKVTSLKKFLWEYFTNSIDMMVLEKELFFQVEKLLARNIKVTHLDSHRHIHFLPKIFGIMEKAAKKYSIPFIRCSRGRVSYLGKKIPHNCIKEIAISLLNNKIPKDKWCRADYVAQIGLQCQLSHIKRFILDKKEATSTVEFVFHPNCSGERSSISQNQDLTILLSKEFGVSLSE